MVKQSNLSSLMDLSIFMASTNAKAAKAKSRMSPYLMAYLFLEENAKSVYQLSRRSYL